MTRRVAIYSAVFGTGDALKPPVPQRGDVDFYFYTDQSVTDAGLWNVIHVPAEADGRLQAKFYKLQPHLLPELASYDVTIWIDGSIHLVRNDFVEWALAHIGDSGWAMFRAEGMDCLYQEAAHMARTKKYAAMPIAEQSAFYRTQQCPEHLGLFMGGVIVRDHRHADWVRLCDAWWQENTRWTLRDQISLPYVLWRENGTLDVLPGTIYDCPYLRVDNAHRQHEYAAYEPTES